MRGSRNFERTGGRVGKTAGQVNRGIERRRHVSREKREAACVCGCVYESMCICM